MKIKINIKDFMIFNLIKILILIVTNNLILINKKRHIINNYSTKINLRKM